MNLKSNGIKAFLASIVPGIFLVGYNIGTGSITTMASGGANFGMSLLWALLLSCVFTYVMIIAFSKYTIVTKETSLHAFKTHFGKVVTIFIVLSILISETISCVGVMGVVTQVIQEWSRPLTAEGEGFSPIVIASICCVLLYYLFWQGRNSFFEKILSVFVFVMGACFLVTLFFVMPSISSILEGVIPTIPHRDNSFLIIAGMVGTTMGGVLYVVRSILVNQASWQINDMGTQKRDAVISVSLMFILSFAVMACAAGTMYPKGLHVDNAIDMVRLMEPLAGHFATSLFVSGIVSAGLSSLFPIIVLGPWLISDYLGVDRDLTKKWARGLALFTTLCGLIVPLLGGRPIFVMILSQSLAIVSTPLVILLMVILLNKKELMGSYVATRWNNIIYGITLLFSLIISIIAIIGLI